MSEVASTFQPEQLLTIPRESNTSAIRWSIRTIVREHLPLLVSFIAAIAWNIEMFRLTDTPSTEDGRSPWEKIEEAKANPDKYRMFDFQTLMPKNPIIGHCTIIRGGSSGMPVYNPDKPNELVLLLCAAQGPNLLPEPARKTLPINMP